MKNRSPIATSLNPGELLYVTHGRQELNNLAHSVSLKLHAALANRHPIARQSFLEQVKHAVDGKAKKIQQGEQLDINELNEPFSQRTLALGRETTLTNEEIEQLTKQAGGHWESAR